MGRPKSPEKPRRGDQMGDPKALKSPKGATNGGRPNGRPKSPEKPQRGDQRGDQMGDQMGDPKAPHYK